MLQMRDGWWVGGREAARFMVGLHSIGGEVVDSLQLSQLTDRITILRHGTTTRD